MRKWPPVVVVVGELLEQRLQRGQVRGGRAGAQPVLEGLVQPLDLALGLGVVGGAVLLRDAELVQFGLEGVGAAAVAGGEHESVVGQR